ncbi:MAG: TAXI family TRAP transporter solute-binding subunit [Hyphomicrobiaceae bacterium]
MLEGGMLMLKRALTAVAAVGLIGMTASGAWSQTPKDLKWGTPPVGSAGHKSLVALSTVLNKEMPEYRISVLPTAGAVATMKGFATLELDGFFGSDVGFEELAHDTKRFKGFKAKIQRPLAQSFWSQTIEVGLAVKAVNKGKYKGWRDFAGKRIFTGPLPFDTRAHTERGLNALGVKFDYVQVDLATVGSQLDSSQLDGITIYTASETSPPPWLAEASLATDWAVVNPSAEEIAELKKKGLSVVEVSPKAYKRDIHADKSLQLPFFYGFHVGLNVSEADVYKMLTIVEKNVAEIAKADPGLSQIAKDMKGFQVRGVAAAVDLVPIHPGLAKWMKEKGVWDAKWDSRIAKK